MRTLAFLLFLSAHLPALGQESLNSYEARWKYALSVTRKYSPGAYEILTHVHDPANNYHGYLGTHTEKSDVLACMLTLVHEACHEYNFHASSGSDKFAYYAGPGEMMYVTRGAFYNSHELNRMVPAELQEYIFRYSNYIRDSSGLTSQVDGIYGLLDEFTCYYQEAKLSMDMREEYEAVLEPDDWKGWGQNYLTGISSQITAFYEFRLFFAWYLMYAKEKYPAIYAELYANISLRKTLTTIYDRFKAQADRYTLEVAKVASDLNANGVKAVIEGSWFMIYSSVLNGEGFGLQTEYIQRLTDEFEKAGRAELEAFRMK